MTDGQIQKELQTIEKSYQRKVAVIEAQPKMRRIALFTWAVIDVILLVLFIGYIGSYVVMGMRMDAQDVAGIATNINIQHGVVQDGQPDALLVRDAQVLTGQDGYYDFVSTVTNSNAQWSADISYYFTSKAGDTQMQHMAVVPYQELPLLALHQEFSSRPSSVEIVIDDVQWERVDAHEISDTAAWLEDHDQFTISDASYEYGIELGDETIGISTMTVTNSTPYNYWNARFAVLLSRNGTIEGVNEVTIPSFLSSDSRTVELSWFGTSIRSGDIEVLPLMNYLDASIYMEQDGDLQDFQG